MHRIPVFLFSAVLYPPLFVTKANDYSSSSFIDIIGRDLLPPLLRGLSPGLLLGPSSFEIVIAGGSRGLELLDGRISGLASPASISTVSGLGCGIKFCPASDVDRLWFGDISGSYSQALLG